MKTRNSKLLRVAAVLSFALLAISAPAGAFDYELDLSSCDQFGCEGSSLFLGVDDLGGNDYHVTLILDSTSYSGNRDGVVQAGFKAFGDFASVSLTNDPGGTWSSPVEATINSNGSPCSPEGNSGHICTSGFVDVAANPGQYVWEFDVTDATLLATSDWHIGFQYCNEDTEICRGKIISATGAPVPEPSAALVFGAALLVAAPRLRRRR